MPPKFVQKGRKAPSKKRTPKRTTKKATTSTAPDHLPAIDAENTDAKDEALTMEEHIAPLEAVEEERTTRLEVEVGKIQGETYVSANEGEITTVDEAEEEKVTKLEVEEPGVEKTSEESMVEKIQRETIVGEAVEDKDNGDEENDREEEGEGEEEAEEKDDRQGVEYGMGKDEVECITADDGNEEGDLESISGGDEENEEADPSMCAQAPTTDIKRQKNFALFVGGLDKKAVDDDLISVFGAFGKIQSVRIVKDPLTYERRGFAFIWYASIEHAKRALAELKDGTRVNGKKVWISVGPANDTLYLGNICRTWTRDQVLETLKDYGVEQIVGIFLPDDPHEGKIKGFAFVEFETHLDAMSAFQRLKRQDAVFGRNVSARVAFAQAPLQPSEEDLLKVKTVLLEGIPNYWDEVKVEELCKQYGKIERIQLSRNFRSAKRKNSAKKKDLGFVQFSSRDEAVACMEGINNSHLGENVTLKTCFAKPVTKFRVPKWTRGGFEVQKNEQAAEVTIEEAGKSEKKDAKSKAVVIKKETHANFVVLSGAAASKPQDKRLKETEGSQTSQFTNGNKRDWEGTATAFNQQPSKRQCYYNEHEEHGGSSRIFTNPRSSYSSSPYMLDQTTYAQTAPSDTAHADSGVSGSQHHRTDPEPHARFLPAANRVQDPHACEWRRAGACDPRSGSGYLGALPFFDSFPVKFDEVNTFGEITHAQTAPSDIARSHPGAYRTDLEPHAGFLPAANQVQKSYAYEWRSRAGAHDPRSSSGYLGAPPFLDSCSIKFDKVNTFGETAYAQTAPCDTAHAHPGASGSQHHRTDLNSHAYEWRRSGACDTRSGSGYLGAPPFVDSCSVKFDKVNTFGETTYAQTAPSDTAHAHSGVSGSQYHRTDPEPHAGFLPAANQVQNPYAYEWRRACEYDSRSGSGYLGASMVHSSYPVQGPRAIQSSYPAQISIGVHPVQNSHLGYSSLAGNQVGYAYPSGGTCVYPRSYY